jgi:hypothetical protein
MTESFAAIHVTQRNLDAIFASVAEIPAGRARLAWALFRYPYDGEDEFFYVGGNYLHRNQPDFERQLFSRSELDACFTYDLKKLQQSMSTPQGSRLWFVVKPKPEQIERMKEGFDEEIVS